MSSSSSDSPEGSAPAPEPESDAGSKDEPDLAPELPGLERAAVVVEPPVALIEEPDPEPPIPLPPRANPVVRVLTGIGESTWLRVAVVLGALALVLAAPFWLRPAEGERMANADRTLVIISPHNEGIRLEFAHGFGEHMEAKTGEQVRIDWRDLGGTSQITQYLDASYQAAFEHHWKTEVEKKWRAPGSPGLAAVNYKTPGGFEDPEKKELYDEARSRFLESDVGVGIDLFFGGGAYPFVQHARKGHLVDCGIFEAEPDWFTDEVIPATASGETLYDPDHLWVGGCLSAFGIIYNPDVLDRIGVSPPKSWRDLGDPLYYGTLAMADPTKSGSATKAFEMLIQEQLAIAVKAIDPEKVLNAEAARVNALDSGWTEGLNLIQAISANSRYFSDSSTKVPYDVAQGNAAAGMCIDFYGRALNEQYLKPDGSSRVQFVSPPAGTSVGADGIGMLRGSPNKDLALEFVRYVLSTPGQRLWHYKTTAPGGPREHALRRMPIRKDAYSEADLAHSSDPDVLPFERSGEFYYEADWTLKYYSVISFVVQVMCLDTHDELREAWGLLIENDFPPRATEIFFDVSASGYSGGGAFLIEVLNRGDPTAVQQERRTLRENFRNNYKLAASLARQGK